MCSFQNCRSSFVYSAKNKKRGDQIPPKESSICGKFSLGTVLRDRAIVSYNNAMLHRKEMA